jgi:hypothetical protein
VKGDGAPRPDERDRLGDDLLGGRHVHQHQPRRRHVEPATGETSRPRVAPANLDVGQFELAHQLSGEGDRIGAALDAQHVAARSHPLGEQIQTAPRAAAELDHRLSGSQPYLVEQPRRVVGEQHRLLSQPLLLGGAVSEEVLINGGHRHGALTARTTSWAIVSIESVSLLRVRS